MRTVSIAAICLGAALLAGRVEAQDGSAYIGASAGRAEVDARFRGNLGFSNAYDTDDIGFKVFAGYRLLDWFGIEGGYVDLDDFAIRVEYERFGFESFFGGFRHPELLSVGFSWTFC